MRLPILLETEDGKKVETQALIDCGAGVVLGKLSLVRFEPFLAKLETEWFGFSQDLPKPNLNRLKPFQIGFKRFETN